MVLRSNDEHKDVEVTCTGKGLLTGATWLFHQFQPRISGIWQAILPLGREEVLPPLMPNKVEATQPTGQMVAGTPFSYCYNLCLCLNQKNKQMLSKWEVFTTLLCQLAMIDGSIMSYLWNSKDYNTQPAILLEPELFHFLVSQSMLCILWVISGWTTPSNICLSSWALQ